MAKDVGKAQADGKAAAPSKTNSQSLSVGFKKKFTPGETAQITTKRRELRERLVAAG